MGHHTFDASRAAKLERADRRYRSVSREELLWALDPGADETVVDLGSGTGFYTDAVAPHAALVYAVDIQEAMHDYYREKGLPENVEPVRSGIENLPFETGAIDAALSTMTYHEFASDPALAELSRVVRSGGRLAVFDWSADGRGEEGPPTAERYGLDETVAALDAAGFETTFRASRPETFVVVAEAR